MSDLELAKVTAIMQDCNQRHEETREKQDKIHLTKVKKAITIRVGLPVGVLSVLLIWVLGTLYSIGVDNARVMKTIELQTATIEQQTQSIGAEVNARVMSDQQLENELKALNAELKANFQWMIEHGTMKQRGSMVLPNLK